MTFKWKKVSFWNTATQWEYHNWWITKLGSFNIQNIATIQKEECYGDWAWEASADNTGVFAIQ